MCLYVKFSSKSFSELCYLIVIRYLYGRYCYIHSYFIDLETEGRLNNYSHEHLTSKKLLQTLFITSFITIVIRCIWYISVHRHTNIIFMMLSTIHNAQHIYKKNSHSLYDNGSFRISKELIDNSLRSFDLIQFPLLILEELRCTQVKWIPNSPIQKFRTGTPFLVISTFTLYFDHRWSLFTIVTMWF